MAGLEALAVLSEIKHPNGNSAVVSTDLINSIIQKMTSMALLKSDNHGGQIIDTKNFPDFDSLKLQEDKIRKLDLVPRRSNEVQADYEQVPTDDFVRLVENYYFANGVGMALVRETHPTDLPADVDQHVVWFKDGTSKEEVAEFIGEFLVGQDLGTEDVILFERSRKTKTPLVGAAIYKYRHIHIWTRKRL